MQIGEYIERLSATKTFRDRLIAIQEYNYTTRFIMFPVPPQLPKADLDKHHIVLKITGGQPHIMGVITDRGSTYEPSSQDNGNLLFVTVQMKPQLMKIVSPTGGYQFGDGHHIDTEFRIRYRVEDAKLLWHASDDPLAEFQLKVIDRAKEYFLSIKSNLLISSSSELKQMLQQQLQDSELKLVKDNVQVSVKKIHVDGIELLDVNADMQLSQELRKHLQGIHQSIYGTGGLLDIVNRRKINNADRKQIDEMIDQDTTFPGYSLRQIIFEVDSELLENFYTESWTTAMRKVHTGIAKKKQEVMRKQDELEMERLEQYLQRAIRLNLGKMEIDQIRSTIAEKFLAMMNAEQDPQSYSNERFFTVLIGPSSNSQRQIHGKTSQQLPVATAEESENNEEF